MIGFANISSVKIGWEMISTIGGNESLSCRVTLLCTCYTLHRITSTLPPLIRIASTLHQCIALHYITKLISYNAQVCTISTSLVANRSMLDYRTTTLDAQPPKSACIRQAHRALVKRGTSQADGVRGRAKRARLQCEVRLFSSVPLILVLQALLGGYYYQRWPSHTRGGKYLHSVVLDSCRTPQKGQIDPPAPPEVCMRRNVYVLQLTVPSCPSMRLPCLPGRHTRHHPRSHLNHLGVRLPCLPGCHARHHPHSHLGPLPTGLSCLPGRHHPRSHLSHLGMRLPCLPGRHARHHARSHLGPLPAGLLHPPSHLLVEIIVSLAQHLTSMPSRVLLSILSIRMLWHSSISFVQPRWMIP